MYSILESQSSKQAANYRKKAESRPLTHKVYQANTQEQKSLPAPQIASLVQTYFIDWAPSQP